MFGGTVRGTNASLRVPAESDLEAHKRWAADMRYSGQTHELRVPIERGSDTVAGMRTAFNAEHQAQYRTVLDDPIELVNLHLIATRKLPKPAMPTIPSNGEYTLAWSS